MTRPAIHPATEPATPAASSIAMTTPQPRTAPDVRPALFAGRSAWSWARFLVPAVLGIWADLATKHWAFPQPLDLAVQANGRFAQHPWQAIPGVLTVETVLNAGGVFGQMQGWAGFLAIFSAAAVLAIIYAFVRSRRQQIWVHIALGLILAGALGNLYDRARFGVVRDFLRFNTSWYPFVFNVADVLLCIGVPLLLLCWMQAPAEGSAREAGGGAGGA
jgi:signal peptidase II